MNQDMNQVLETAIKHWRYIAPLVRCPKNKKEYETLVARLDKLLDIVGNDENHPLIGLVDILSNQIAAYEDAISQDLMGKGVDALKFLMDAHHLRQSDLHEIASQGVISEILNGKRPLNLRQIKLLAGRFNVDPSTFIDA
jgi:HTH-type transcriptional regulator / antitoxin HigA